MAEIKTVKKVNPEKRRKRNFRLAVFMTFLLLTIVSSFISYTYVVNHESERGKIVNIEIKPEDGIAVEIPFGSTTSDIADILGEKDIISHPFVFKMMSKINGYDGLYKSGTHIVSEKLSYDEMMIVLTGNPVSKKVTIPEGYGLKQITSLLVSKGLVGEDKFQSVIMNEKYDFKFLEGLSKRENRLEGYLFPDTYEFDLKAGEKEIVRRMLLRFDDVFRPDFYEKAKNLGLTVDEVIILASIIEREAKYEEERRLISGVFYNRLKGKHRAPKKLESCATIQYILYNRDGKIKEKLLDEDTKIDNRYNTYLHEGLPPGPICNPGRESIEAALNPEDTDYLYFVAKGDGFHEFSRTLAEHKSAVKRYGLK
ncbi:MAG: endolytic transglycosylase MltG [Clostridia bacterium]|nr:endolytic transglycosylase MltG [Clostridia bacterium]